MYRGTRPLLASSRRLLLGTRPPPIVPPVPPTGSCALPSSQFDLRRTILPAIPLTRRSGYSTKPPLQPNKVDKKLEKEVRAEKLKPRAPEEVTSESTVRTAFEGSGAPNKPEGDVAGGVKSDLNVVKDAVSLGSVPREPLALGLAGTLPYLATSISTLYLSWDLNTAWPTQSHFLNSLMVSHDTAAHWLYLLEHIQLGYGAVLISFLGAVHWGLEYGEKTASPARARFRYGLGVAAPAVAWPTLLMPVEWALTSQFLAFTMQYFADARACSRGWAPAWYGTYRFVLTFVVGGAILISLVGRAKIGEGERRLTTDSLRKSMHKGIKGSEPYVDWEKLEAEDKEKARKEKEEEEKKAKKSKKDGKKDEKGDDKEDDSKEKEEESNDDDNSDDKEESTDDKEDSEGGEKKEESGEGKSDGGKEKGKGKGKKEKKD